VRLTIFRAEHHVFRTNEQLAARGHGVPGVDAEIHHDLLDHGRICVQQAHVVGEVDLEFDFFTDQRLQHLFQIGEDVVEPYVGHLTLLAATEAEQLTGKSDGPFGRLEDLLQILISCLFGRQSIQRELREGSNGL
jgi:hypothetical protein